MLRVAVITQNDPFYLPQFFRTFFDRRPQSVEVVWVSLLDAFNESTVDFARRAYTLYGPINFVRRGTEYSDGKRRPPSDCRTTPSLRSRPHTMCRSFVNRA